MKRKDWAEQGYADESNFENIKEFYRALPENPRVLDLCCGAGYDSQRLFALGAEVVGLDLSNESLLIAREHNPMLTFHLGNMLEDYSHIGMVDGILCFAGLVHLTAEQLPTAFERMASVVKKGGSVLLMVRDGKGRISKFSDVLVDGEEFDRSVYAHTLDELQAAADVMFEFTRELERGLPHVWRNYIFNRI